MKRRIYPVLVSSGDQQSRLEAASRAARAAEDRGDDVTAVAEWRRYRLIENICRDPEDLLEEGVALSIAAATLIEPTP